MKILYIVTVFSLLSMLANAQIVNIPDANFKTRLLAASSSQEIAKDALGQNIAIDTNQNGEIEVLEAQLIYELKVWSSPVTTTNDIVDLTGIAAFTNLTDLNCGGNQISSLDLSGNTNLVNLLCQNNQMNSLTLTGLNNLEKIAAGFNNFTSVDLTMLPALKYAFFGQNQLTNLTIAGLSNLVEVVCDDNQLAELDVTGLSGIFFFQCANNQLTTLDVQQMPNVYWLDCSSNPITAIDVSGTSLEHFYINNTLVSSIDVSGTNSNLLHCSDNPNLTYINVRNGVFSSSDPDLLFFAFRFDNLPSLTSICIDGDATTNESGNLDFTDYNASGNVVVYYGDDCSIPLGNDDLDAIAFRLYPNPAGETAYIDSGQNTVESVNIYNAFGQFVKPVSLSGNPTSIDLGDLASGVYFVEVATPNGKAIKKLIKI
jgi:hypothetical protein